MQSFIALGEGGKWGRGLGAGRQKMFYLPEAHTDFVFAVIAEEFGMIGAVVVVTLFVVILFAGCESRTTSRSVRESARGGTDRLRRFDGGVDQHVGGDRPDPDQGIATAIPQLRRHFDDDRDG